MLVAEAEPGRAWRKGRSRRSGRMHERVDVARVEEGGGGQVAAADDQNRSSVLASRSALPPEGGTQSGRSRAAGSRRHAQKALGPREERSSSSRPSGGRSPARGGRPRASISPRGQAVEHRAPWTANVLAKVSPQDCFHQSWRSARSGSGRGAGFQGIVRRRSRPWRRGPDTVKVAELPRRHLAGVGTTLRHVHALVADACPIRLQLVVRSRGGLDRWRAVPAGSRRTAVSLSSSRKPVANISCPAAEA